MTLDCGRRVDWGLDRDVSKAHPISAVCERSRSAAGPLAGRPIFAEGPTSVGRGRRHATGHDDGW